MSVIYSLLTGRLHGWRAKAAVVLLVAAVVLGIWASRDPRGVANGTWDIDPGKGRTLSLEVSKRVDVKVECVPTAGAEEPYAIYMVDEENEKLLTSANSAPAEAVARVEGSGPLTLPPTSVTAGNYWVVVENHGQGTLTVKYKVYQMPR